jgi:hypothetical protein
MPVKPNCAVATAHAAAVNVVLFVSNLDSHVHCSVLHKLTICQQRLVCK